MHKTNPGRAACCLPYVFFLRSDRKRDRTSLKLGTNWKILNTSPAMSIVSLYLIGFFMVSATAAPDTDKLIQKIDTRIEQQRFADVEFQHLAELIELLGKTDAELAMEYMLQIARETGQVGHGDAFLAYIRAYSGLVRQTGASLEDARFLEDVVRFRSSLLTGEVYYEAQFYIAGLYEHLGEDVKAGVAYTKVVERDNDETRRAKALMHRASLLNRAGKIDLSIADYIEAMPVYQEAGDKGSLINAHIGLGRLYMYMGDHDAAIVAYEEAIIIAFNANRKRDLGLGYLNIGTAFEAKGDLDRAMAFYEKGLKIGLDTGDKGLVAQNYLNVGNVYLKNGQYNQAMSMYSRSLDISYREEITYAKLMNYMNMGNAYFQLGQFRKAVASYDKAYAYAERMNVTNERRELYEKYAYVYAGLEDFPNAYYYHTVFHKMESELFNAEKMRVVEELKIAYESELLSQKLELATMEMERKKAQNNMLWISILALLVGSLIFILYLIYRNKQYKALYHKNVLELRREEKQQLKKQVDTGLEVKEDGSATGTLFDEIEVCMREDKLYTDTELTVAGIARHLQSNTKYVSNAIAEHAEVNFNNYVNYFRVNEAKRLILRHRENANLGEIMQEAGFKSRTTFYNAFRKFTGMSPQKFKSFATGDKEDLKQGDAGTEAEIKAEVPKNGSVHKEVVREEVPA